MGSATATMIGGDASVIGELGIVHDDGAGYAGQESPEETLRVAWSLLTAGAVTEARRRLLRPATDGLSGVAVLLHCFAILHGRTARDLEDHDLDQLAAHFRWAEREADHPQGEHFADVVRWIGSLLTALQQRATEPTLGAHVVRRAVSARDGLPDGLPTTVPLTGRPGRTRTLLVQDEIGRHLARLLASADAEATHEAESRRIARHRRDPDRARAELFFVPEPAEPRQIGTLQPPELRRNDIAVAVGAALLLIGAVMCVTLLLPALTFGTALEGVFVVLVVGVLALRLMQRAVARELRRRWEREQQSDFGVLASLEGDANRVHAFCSEVNRAYSRAFALLTPHELPEAERWISDSRHAMVRLARGAIAVYGQDYLRSPEALAWLAQSHAEQAYQEWRSGQYEVPKPSPTHPLEQVATFAFGLVALVASVHLLIVLLLAGRQAAFLALALLALGLAIGGRAMLSRRILVEGFADRWARVQRRWVRDSQNFGALRDRLQDRPTDDELSNWLDLDVTAIRHQVMRDHDLEPDEVVTYVVLTQAAPDCVAARVKNGPARYSAYTVHLFLLTDTGVRESVTALDFLTGRYTEVSRRTYRFEQVTSATVQGCGAPVRSRSSTALAQILVARRLPAPASTPPQSFLLTLGNGEAAEIVLEDYGRWEPPVQEDPKSLLQLSLDTSGVAAALPVLEEVAAEGAGWIRRQRHQHGPDRRRASEHPGRTGPGAPAAGTTDTGDGTAQDLPAAPVPRPPAAPQRWIDDPLNPLPLDPIVVLLRLLRDRDPAGEPAA